jgi:hypothetical protein
MWWWLLQFVGMVGFAVLIAAAYSVWRKRPVGERDRSLARLLIAGTAVLAVGLLALAATALL